MRRFLQISIPRDARERRAARIGGSIGFALGLLSFVFAPVPGNVAMNATEIVGPYTSLTRFVAVKRARNIRAARFTFESGDVVTWLPIRGGDATLDAFEAACPPGSPLRVSTARFEDLWRVYRLEACGRTWASPEPGTVAASVAMVALAGVFGAFASLWLVQRRRAQASALENEPPTG